ncbi:phytochrome B [Acrasis kona]|uniref:Phytochrome B n=1 Tax=Acrasis kona TaxID=1008807 RepID=A0AAW2YYW0_9EUKA
MTRPATGKHGTQSFSMPRILVFCMILLLPTMAVIYYTLLRKTVTPQHTTRNIDKITCSFKGTPKFDSLLDLLDVRTDYESQDDPSTAYFLEEILKYLSKRGLKLDNKICTIHGGNVGAPIYEFLDKPNIGGVAVEFYPNLYEDLTGRVKRKNLNIMQAVVTPHNVINIMDQNDLPYDMDLFKVDIDSYECTILEAMLSSGKYRPKVIFSEHAEFVPPPLRFSISYYEYTTQFKNDNFCGCSLQMHVDLLLQYGYRLVHVDWNDVFFVRDDIYCKHFSGLIPHDVDQIYDQGYAKRDQREHYFNWHPDVDHWMNMRNDLPTLKKEITVYMAKSKTYQSSPQAHFILHYQSPDDPPMKQLLK